MKKILIGAAASALLAPIAAHAETTGFVDIACERSESGPGAVDLGILGGPIQHDFTSGWGIQAEFRSTQRDNGSFTVSSDYAAAHLYTALNPNVDVAAFVGKLALPSGGDAWDAGVEARIHQGQWLLQGSLGYLNFPNTPLTSEAWDTRVRGAWFLNQDTALTPSIAYFEWQEGNFNRKHFAVGVGAAHRFANGLEVYADYLHGWNEYTPIPAFQVDTARVGVRLHLNGGDLQTITNHGPSWSGAAGVYENFGRF